MELIVRELNKTPFLGVDNEFATLKEQLRTMDLSMQEKMFQFTIEPTRMLDNSIIEMNCGLSYFKHCQTKGFVV